MICRVATFDHKPDVPEERMSSFRAWMSSQPGLTKLYHLYDPATDKAISISFWDSMEAMLALKDRVPPGGPMGLKPSSVEIFPDVIES